MITKSKIKFIKSLHQKKVRNNERVFIVEGAKNLAELFLSDYKILSLFLTNEFFNCYSTQIASTAAEVHTASTIELGAAGTLQTNQSGLAIVEMKDHPQLEPSSNQYTLLLDGIQDPGNLGTIIRIADWYGIKNIVCSYTTAEFYNPKVLGATMGSFTRISICYCELTEYLLQHKLPVYGALLSGQNVHTTHFPQGGFLVIGNESAGISLPVQQFINYPIGIPKYGGAESLNAAIATAVILDNIMRHVPALK